MTKPRLPVLLRVWLSATRVLPAPIRLVSRYMHSRMGAAPERFAERLGLPSQTATHSVIWFHAASLGEVAQIGPLVRQLGQSDDRTILVTTTTAAGADWVARELPEALHQYAPIETHAAVTGFLSAWDISIALFVEGDLWPRLVMETRRRDIPRILLNARHSHTRDKHPAVFQALLDGFSRATCRSEPIAASLRGLGLPAKAVRVLPDLRIATAKLPCPPELLASLRERIGKRPVWLAASTHPADEAAVLGAHSEVLAAHPDTLLILAPRHPKRGAPLEIAAQDQGLNVTRRNAEDALTAKTQVYIADTLGELGVFFSLAPVAFIGGSFGDEGGHNPYEPASFGGAILSGPKVKNFKDAYAALTDVGAAQIVATPDALGENVAPLIGSDQAKDMGAAGQDFMAASENSVSVTVDLIEEILRTRSKL